jgi:hypothetical protein
MLAFIWLILSICAHGGEAEGGSGGKHGTIFVNKNAIKPKIGDPQGFWQKSELPRPLDV